MVKGAIRAAGLSLIVGLASLACVGTDRQAHTTPTATAAPAYQKAPLSLTEGDYCIEGLAAGSRLEFLARLENNAVPSTAKKSPEELEDLSASLVFLNRHGGGLFQGFYLGSGYVVTVAHGFVEKTEVRVEGDPRRYVQFSVSKTDVGYLDELSRPVSEKILQLELMGAQRTLDLALLPVQSTSVHTKQDIALAYSPSPYTVGLPSFKLSKELKANEQVYLIAFDPGSPAPIVSRGIITSLSGSSSEFSGQFQISVRPKGGYSGAPVFDAYGNLIGILSSAVTKPRVVNSFENYIGSNVSSIDAIVELAQADKQQVLICPK